MNLFLFILAFHQLLQFPHEPQLGKTLFRTDEYNYTGEWFRIKIRIRMSFISQVCLHIRGICYSDRSSTVQQNDSNRTEHRQQKNNIQIYE